jgi:hypothetical protein
MQHKLDLTVQEKLKACLDLSDFIFKMMRNILKGPKFNQRLKDLRERHLRETLTLLKVTGKAKNE